MISRHPNILRMYGWFQDPKRVFMVMQLAPHGDLLRIMEAEPRKRFSERVSANYLKQLTDAMKYVHNKKIIHRDVKLANLLLGDKNVLKLTDFGWAVHTPSCTSTRTCGTRCEMAPEMFLDESYTCTVDIWAIGVVGYHMITGRAPFFGRNKEDLIKKITNVEIVYPSVQYFSTEARDLISKVILIGI